MFPKLRSVITTNKKALQCTMTQQFLISRSYNNPYLMKRRESIHICRVDVCPPGQKFLHLLAIPRSTGGQKNTTITEPYPTFSFGFRRFPERLAVLPPLELLGPLHESRVGPGLQRQGGRHHRHRQRHTAGAGGNAAILPELSVIFL